MISEDKLAINWTLTRPELDFIRRSSRKMLNTISMAAQLCHLRSYSCFIDKNNPPSLDAINYLAQQLEYKNFTKLPNFIEVDRIKIASYLGFVSFDDNAKSSLKLWLDKSLRKQIYDKDTITSEARLFLKSQRIILPSKIVLGRILSSSIKLAYKNFYQAICDSLPKSAFLKIDNLIETEKSGMYSNLVDLKKSPASASAKILNEYLGYYDELKAIGIYEVKLKVKQEIIKHFAKLCRCYSVYDLRRISLSVKKYAIIICFLHETAGNVLDLVIQMNANILGDIKRKATNQIKTTRAKLMKKAKGSLRLAGKFIREAVSKKSVDIKLPEFMKKFDSASLLMSADICDEIEQIEEFGIANKIVTRFGYLRRYSKRFLLLNFRGSEGMEALMQNIETLRAYNEGNIKTLPQNVSIKVLPKIWQNLSHDAKGKIQHNYWEMGMYFAIKKHLASGDLYLPESNNHRYFWDSIYNEEAWKAERKIRYDELGLAENFDVISEKLLKQFRESTNYARNLLKNNDFARIESGKLIYSKDNALHIPAEVKTLGSIIKSNLPKIRIEELLAQSDKLANFTSSFKSLNILQKKNNVLLPKRALYGAIIAHATNIGLYGMGHNAVGLSTEMIKNASQIYIRSETLKEANDIVINKHLEYDISKIFGDGMSSSSDGQRYAIQASSMLASYYPRYFGYYDKAISLYTHTSDKFDVFNTRVISCGEREASYVLTGLLMNKSNLNPLFHSTDTHGFTNHVFALCFLLGFSFQPRLKDLDKQRLFKIKGTGYHGELEDIFSGEIDIDESKDYWDQIVRILAALKNGHIAPHIVIQKLAVRTDKTAKALNNLGKIIKTIYLLRYISDKDLRHKVRLQLNRGEYRHTLAKALFFANRGVFKTNNYEEIMNKASCLSLLSNAVLLWNCHHMEKIIAKLRKQEEVSDEHLKKISPLICKRSVNPTAVIYHLLFYQVRHSKVEDLQVC